MTARRPFRRCLDCQGNCRWADPAWTCQKCGREWMQDTDPRYAPPSGAGPALFTCSYTEHRPAMGLGVRISLGTPRWIKRIEPWPYISELTPRKAYLNVPSEADFLDAYLMQLKAYGADTIRHRFAEIAAKQKVDRLVLLCFEKLSKGKPCHRRYFASWWYTATGQTVPELGDVPTHEQLDLFAGSS